MSFVQRDDMVQDLSATTSNPVFRGSVLPGRLDARPLRFLARRLQKRNHAGIEFRIAIEDHVTVWASFRKGLEQLLHDPLRARMLSSANRRISPRISSVAFGRPPRRRDRQRQYSREASPVPVGDGLGVHNHEHIAPA